MKHKKENPMKKKTLSKEEKTRKKRIMKQP